MAWGKPGTTITARSCSRSGASGALENLRVDGRASDVRLPGEGRTR